MSDAIPSRAAICDCWRMTPWGTWERLTSAPCVHKITAQPAVAVRPTEFGWSGAVWWSGRTNA